MDEVNIVVLDGDRLNPGDNPWNEVQSFGHLTVYDRTAPELILERSADAELILTNKTPLTREILGRLPRLKYIGMLSTGYNVVDVRAARERDIPVSNVPVYGTHSVAQYVFALLLELCHHIGLHTDSVAAGEWTNGVDWCYWKTPLVELYGKTMAVIGFGRIGQRVGTLAHAFGMEVLAVDIVQAQTTDYQPFAYADLNTALGRADVISLNCALSEDNKGLINRDTLDLMKSSAVLINAARGGLVNEADLAAALNSGRLSGAALDVVSTEPIKAGNPLLQAKNCLITPHMAWGSLEARRRLMHTVAENIEAFLAEKPQNVVNP